VRQSAAQSDEVGLVSEVYLVCVVERDHVGCDEVAQVYEVDLVSEDDLACEMERVHLGPDEVDLVLEADLVYVAVPDCVHYPHPEVCRAAVQCEMVVYVVELDHVERSFPERMTTSGKHSGSPRTRRPATEWILVA